MFKLMVLMICVMILLTSSIFATIIYVPSDQPTIQAGIDASSEGDTVLVADGVYKGPGNFNLSFNGKNLVVKSSNGPDFTSIDCDNLGRAFIFDNYESALSKVAGFKIVSGKTDELGGAIYCDSALPVIENCVFSNNFSGFRGGAIYATHESDIQVIECKFENNVSGGYGGGVYLHWGSDAVIIDCLFDGNQAAHGGALIIDKSTPEVERNLFIHNRADNIGGAIFIQDDCKSTIKNCTFADNYGTTGAVFFIEERYDYWPVEVVISDCILYMNKGDDPIVQIGDSFNILNTDLYDNEFGNWVGSVQDYEGIQNNFSADPEFCDAETDNYHIKESSPCAPENNDAERLVGALGVGCESEYQTVYFDIKPESCPNPLNLKTNNGKAVLPTAILGTGDFDVHDIDPSTVTLLGQSPVRWSYEDAGTPYEGEECECSDDGPDGYNDLTLKFDRNALVDSLMKLPCESQIELAISGQLNDGTELEGSDCVKVIRSGRLHEAVTLDGDVMPIEITLKGNNPNPFNPTTTINYGLPNQQHVKIEIYNTLGQKVTTLVDKNMPAGNHSVEWDASGLASGIYLYRLVTVEKVETKKMVLLK